MPKEELKSVLLKMDHELHDQVADMASHYAGGNVRATILRYIRLGLAYDAEAIRRERDAFQGGDPSD